MNIQTLTFVYNEEFLLPFYLKHYDWVDKMNIVYDTDSTDRTLQILQANPKVNIIPFTFPDGMDDILKVQKINELYKQLDCEIVLNVDCDEFIFTNYYELARQSHFPIVCVHLAHVYRHFNEKDLDVSLPIKEQRCYGYFDPMYNKPIIVHTGLNLQWLPGNHVLTNNLPIQDCGVLGAHWANADLSFCIERRIKNRKLRQSKVNLENGLTVQNHHVTPLDIINECKMNSSDRKLW